MGTGSSAARAPLEVCAGAGVTYTVPQRILPEKLQKTAEVFFRVGGIYENAEIVVSDGERDLLRRKREHLAPGEMERLAIPAALLREAAGPLTGGVGLGGGVIMKKLVCIVCPRGCRLTVEEGEEIRVSGNACPRGETYARQELFAPVRVLTATVALEGGVHPRLPVKTSGAIPRERVSEAAALLRELRVTAPVKAGQVLLPNILDTGVDVIATRDG